MLLYLHNFHFYYRLSHVTCHLSALVTLSIIIIRTSRPSESLLSTMVITLSSWHWPRHNHATLCIQWLQHYNWCHIYALNKHTIVTDGKWFNIVMFQCPMTSLVTFTNIPPYDYMYTCPYTSQCDYLFPKVYTCPYHILKFSPYPLAVNTSIKFVASEALRLAVIIVSLI